MESEIEKVKNEKKKKGLKVEEEKDFSEPDTALTQCQTTLAEWQEKYTRLTADLDNFKKRTIKERADWAQTSQVKLLTTLLEIVDNFDRAMSVEQEVPQEMQSWVDGVSMIHSAFKEFLTSAGVKETPYDTFNPEFHEALMQVESDAKKSGEIVEVMEKGYVFGDRVVRPAKVSVAK